MGGNEKELRLWLNQEHGYSGAETKAVISDIPVWCIDRRSDAPPENVATRLINSVRRRFNTGLLTTIKEALNENAQLALKASLLDIGSASNISNMKADPDRVVRKTILSVTGRLSFILNLRFAFASTLRL